MPPKRKSSSSDSDDEISNKSCKGAVRGSDDYRKKREKNNMAVKKSREKSRQKARETIDRVNRLKSENADLEQKVTLLSKELSLLKDLFLTHATSGDVCTVKRRHCTVSESSISSMEDEEDSSGGDPPVRRKKDSINKTRPNRQTFRENHGKNTKGSQHCKDATGVHIVNTDALQKDHVYCSTAKTTASTIMTAS